MTYQDPRLGNLGNPLEPPDVPRENTQDVLPPTERNQDPTRSLHELVTGEARPLTEDERKAADRDTTAAGERVYAPASERVPKAIDEYRDVAEHTDTQTPERKAAGPTSDAEPSFARVARPTAGYQTDPFTTEADQPQRKWLPGSLGLLALAGAGVGVWFWFRWQRERNKPINRLRRQARQLRDQMPDLPEIPDEARRPAMGLGTALLSIAIVVWQQWSRSRQTRADRARAQASTARKRAESLSDFDWQERLQALKERWTPARVEVEKVKITRK